LYHGLIGLDSPRSRDAQVLGRAGNGRLAVPLP